MAINKDLRPAYQDSSELATFERIISEIRKTIGAGGSLSDKENHLKLASSFSDAYPISPNGYGLIAEILSFLYRVELERRQLKSPE